MNPLNGRLANAPPRPTDIIEPTLDVTETSILSQRFNAREGERP